MASDWHNGCHPAVQMAHPPSMTWIWPVGVGGTRQIDRQVGDLLGRTDAAHGLARDEFGARLVVVAGGLQPVLQRRRFTLSRSSITPDKRLATYRG